MTLKKELRKEGLYKSVSEDWLHVHRGTNSQLTSNQTDNDDWLGGSHMNK